MSARSIESDTGSRFVRSRGSGFRRALVPLALGAVGLGAAIGTALEAGLDQGAFGHAAGGPGANAVSVLSDDLSSTNPLPAWFVLSARDGGILATNPPAWYVPAGEPEGVGSLYVLLDRAALTNDLLMEVELFDQPGASLFVSLADTNLFEIVTNLCGNLILGSNELVRVQVPLPLAANPPAAVVRLHRGTGEIAVLDVVLSEAMQGQGLDLNRGYAPAAGAALGLVDSLVGSAIGENGGSQPTSASTNLGPQSGDKPFSHDTQACGKRTIHVSALAGHDANDGLSPAPAGTRCGPKKSIAAALSVSRPGDDIRVAEGSYPEPVNDCGKGVMIFFEGDVRIP